MALSLVYSSPGTQHQDTASSPTILQAWDPAPKHGPIPRYIPALRPSTKTQPYSLLYPNCGTPAARHSPIFPISQPWEPALSHGPVPQYIPESQIAPFPSLTTKLIHSGRELRLLNSVHAREGPCNHQGVAEVGGYGVRLGEGRGNKRASVFVPGRAGIQARQL